MQNSFPEELQLKTVWTEFFNFMYSGGERLLRQFANRFREKPMVYHRLTKYMVNL